MDHRRILNEWENVDYGELHNVAKWVLKHLTDCPMFLLSGAMGSGKTTFVRIYLELLGIHDFEGSPTYNYYNIYPASHIQKDFLVIHMDMSKVPENDREFQNQFEELQFLHATMLIENYNPQKGLLLINNYVNIFFEENKHNTRKIRIEGKSQ